jgi:hypothetical protein
MAQKEEIVTFKADAELMERIRQLPNRSEFIRRAVLAAFDNTCPLCRGAGVLSEPQRVHWEHFLEKHHLEQCSDCAAVHIVCTAEGEAHDHSHGRHGKA